MEVWVCVVDSCRTSVSDSVDAKTIVKSESNRVRSQGSQERQDGKRGRSKGAVLGKMGV